MSAEQREVRTLRREALGNDALLFCGAFAAGAAVYAIARILREAIGADEVSDFWTIGLSDGLILAGLLAGEVFLLWNNGVRQGLRGHSIGKHRRGLRVVDAGTARPTGALRGALRGLVMVVLLDLAVAAIPLGLPTALRTLTPAGWHVGAFAYVALLILLVPIVLPSSRGFADLLVGTSVVRGDATSRGRARALVALDVLGVVGVLTVAAMYVAFYWPLLWRFPSLR